MDKLPAMTDAEVTALLKMYKRRLDDSETLRDPQLAHLLDMTRGMRQMLIDIAELRGDEARNAIALHKLRERLMRWLGFMQGVLWCKHIYSIDDMREHNRGPAPRE